jgi:hypothetical protein
MKTNFSKPQLLLIISFLVSFCDSSFAITEEELAKDWCSRCHLFPEPDLLDRSTWMDHVLPEMGARLGFKKFRERSFNPNPSAPQGIYAKDPMLPSEDWERIINYYDESAPVHLKKPTKISPTRTELFSINLPSTPFSEFPASTAVFIDENGQRLLIGDSYRNSLEIYASDLALIGKIQLAGPISRIIKKRSEEYIVTTLLNSIAPSDQQGGELVEVNFSGGLSTTPSKAKRLARDLNRPVDVLSDDFNNDGLSDYIVSNFGEHFGSLSFFTSLPDGSVERRDLFREAGPISMKIFKNDLWLLNSQARERVIRIRNFRNNRGQDFQTILEFPPSYGSMTLKVADFNDDGLADLIYLAGDNADFSTVYKPYHGIYLFIGTQDGAFQQEMFYPLDGAYGAVIRDFDLDGDLDIAAISYFPNFEESLDQATFVLLENNEGEFVPRFLNGLGKLGRYVAIDAGDLDGDGDQDIALANLAFGALGPLNPESAILDQWLKGPQFVILKNMTVQR